MSLCSLVPKASSQCHPPPHPPTCSPLLWPWPSSPAPSRQDGTKGYPVAQIRNGKSSWSLSSLPPSPVCLPSQISHISPLLSSLLPPPSPGSPPLSPGLQYCYCCFYSCSPQSILHRNQQTHSQSDWVTPTWLPLASRAIHTVQGFTTWSFLSLVSRACQHMSLHLPKGSSHPSLHPQPSHI